MRAFENNKCPYYLHDVKTSLMHGTSDKMKPSYLMKIYKESFEDVFQTVRVYKQYLINPKEIEAKKIMGQLFNKNDKLLFLDMDETLIHTELLPKNLEAFGMDPEAMNYIEHDGKNQKVNIRPKLYEFQDEMAKYYRMILFTSSKKEYADKILDLIDPYNEYFEYKFYRDHCVKARNHVSFFVV